MTSRQLTEDEWVILLDIYQTHRGERLSPTHPALVAASQTLRALGQQTGRGAGEHFRPPSGLHRLIGMFRVLDAPQHVEHKIPQHAKTVWERLSSDPAACRRAAALVRSSVQST